MIRAMSDRGLPIPDGAPACPFVAFDDDRDGRSTAPDHRHRCYAEQSPSPRALAHQDAYCLSSAFPVCPAFQDWARREAAPARRDAGSATMPSRSAPPAASRQAPAPAAAAAQPGQPLAPAPATADEELAGDPVEDGPGLAAWSGRPAERGTSGDARRYPPLPPAVPGRRAVPRDWAAPPPWTADEPDSAPAPAPAPPSSAIPGWSQGPGPAASRPASRDARMDRSRGLAGSDLERLTGPDPAGPSARPAGAYVPDAMRPIQPAPVQRPASGSSGAPSLRSEPPSRQPVDTASGYRDDARVGREPIESRDAHEPRTAAELFGPAWEQPRRFEAYPNLRTRVGLPSFAGVPPVAVASLALVAAAIVLFFVGPMLLGIGGKDKSSASPTPAPTVAATPTPLPTQPPGPTATVYTVVKNDTVVKIAAKFGITVQQLLAANPQIKNPDKIKIGDQLVIPAPIATEIQGVGDASASP
jgi:hypothetical protein